MSRPSSPSRQGDESRPPAAEAASTWASDALEALGDVQAWVGIASLATLFAILATLLHMSGALRQGGDAAQQPAPESQEIIAAMKAEQRWLIAQGLTQERPIGAIGGGEAHGGSAFMTKIQSSDPSLGHARVPQYAIVPAATGPANAPRWSFASDPALTYRHEDGHANMFQDHVQAQAPSSWRGPWGAAMARELNADSHASPTSDDWRERWLANIRSEAFADAFACLSVAKRGQKALRECALSLHARRLFPMAGFENGWTALSVLGNDHSVDMASFMSGQLDATQVSRLDKKGLELLCGRVADETVGWELARAGKQAARGVHFFNQAGRAWWRMVGRGNGWTEERSDKIFRQWSAEVGQDYPEAAFGRASWTIEGMLFAVDKLPASAKRPRWRFEGFSGRNMVSAMMEEGQSGDQPAKGIENSTRDIPPAMDNSATCRQTPERCLNHWADPYASDVKDGREGALDAHWALIGKLGADPADEAQRLKELIGGERHLAALIDHRLGSHAR